MDYYDTEMDMEGHCVVTQTQPLKEPLEPLNEIDDLWHRAEGGILPGSEYAWLSRGPRFRVISSLTGATVMDWSCESPLERAVITCAVLLPGNLGPRHNGKQDLDLRLAVGLVVERNRGLVVVLASGPAIRTRVLSSVHVHSNVLSMALVSSGTQDDDESPLHSVLCRMQGVLALGLIGGEVLLMDLRTDAAECDRTAETHAMPFTVRDDLAHKMAETAVTGDHLALLLNSGSFLEGQYMLQLPDGQVKAKSRKQLVGVLSLLYAPPLASICVGFSFGVFQLWSLSDFTLMFTSKLLASPMPVVRLSWQPPSDDPRACCYLWVAHGLLNGQRNPVAALYALAWERCRRIVGYGELYLTLQSCRLVFELEVGPAERTDDVTLMDVQTVTRRPPAGDASLALFSWAAGPNAGALLFDLDQWYKAQMPDRVCDGAEMFLARYMLDHDDDPDLCHIAARLDEASVTRFAAVRLREEHFFPASVSFNTTWLLSDRVLRASHPGKQTQALKALTRAGPLGIAAPAALFRRCVNVGLRPALSEVEPTLLDSTESQREFLLSLCLEHRSRLALRCALHWADGIQEALGGSLDHWLEWAWQQARTAKATADTICVPLFDLSGRSLDSMAHAMLLLAIGQVCQLASIFKQLQDHLVARRLPARLVETEERCSALALAALYLGGVRCFVSAALLPERPDSDPALANVPFPVVALADNYRQRRAELQRTHQAGELLYVDALVARHPRVSLLWQQEGGDGRYPPPSLQAILRVHLLDNMDAEHKHLIVFYLLQDLATLQRNDGLDGEGLVSSYPDLTPAQRQLARALWLLDHRDFDDAILALGSARPEPWQRDLALRALHAQGRHRLAAQLLHVGGPPQGPAGHRLGVSILLHCDRLTDALAMLREAGTPDTTPALLEHFFRGCHDNNAMGRALQLSLRPNEEEVLFRFLERECGGARGLDMRALYLLSHGRIVEATALASPPGQPATSTRDLLLAAYKRTLPQITLDVASFCRRQRGDITRFTSVLRPEPLTVGVRQTASQETLFAASMAATAAASRTPLMLSAHTQQLPFLRSPRSAATSVGRRTPAVVPRSVSTPTPSTKRKREHTDADKLLMTPRVRRRIQESPAVRPPTSILKARAIPEMSTPPVIRKIRFSLNREEELVAVPAPSAGRKRSSSFLDSAVPNKTVCRETTPSKTIRHEPVVEEGFEESAEDEEEEGNDVEDSDLIELATGLHSSTPVKDVMLTNKDLDKRDELIKSEESANTVVEEVENTDPLSVEDVEDLDSSVQEVEELDSSVVEVEELDSSIQDVKGVDSSVQDVEDSDIEELEVGEIPRSGHLLLDDSRPYLVRNRFQGKRNVSETEEISVEDDNGSKEEDNNVCVEEVSDGVMYRESNDYIQEVREIVATEDNDHTFTRYEERVLVEMQSIKYQESQVISTEEEAAVSKEGELDASIEAADEELQLAEGIDEEQREENIYEAMEVDRVGDDTANRSRRPLFADIETDESEAVGGTSLENVLDVPSSGQAVAQGYGSSQETLEVPTSSELSENPFPRNLDRPVSEYFHLLESSTDLEEIAPVVSDEGDVVPVDTKKPEKMAAIAEIMASVCDEDEDDGEGSPTTYRKRVNRPKFVELDDEDEPEEKENDSENQDDEGDRKKNKIAEENISKKVVDSPTSSELHMIIKDATEEEEEEVEEEEDLDESLEDEEEEDEESDSQDEDSQSESSSSSDIVCLDMEDEPVKSKTYKAVAVVPKPVKVKTVEAEATILTPPTPMISEVCTKDFEEDEEDILNRAILMSTEQREGFAVEGTGDAEEKVHMDSLEGVEETDVIQNVEESESDPPVKEIDIEQKVVELESDPLIKEVDVIESESDPRVEIVDVCQNVTKSEKDPPVEEIDVDQKVVELESDPLVEEVDIIESDSDPLVEGKFGNTSIEVGVNNEAADELESIDEATTDADKLNRAILLLTSPDEDSNDRAVNDDSAEELEIHASPEWETLSNASSVNRRQTRSSQAATVPKAEDLDLLTIQITESEGSLARSEASASSQRQLRSRGSPSATKASGQMARPGSRCVSESENPELPTVWVSESESKESSTNQRQLQSRGSPSATKTTGEKTVTSMRTPEAENLYPPTIQVFESEGSPARSEASATSRRRTRSSYSQPSAASQAAGRNRPGSESEDLELPVFRVSESEASLEGSEASTTRQRRSRSSVLGSRTPEIVGKRGESAGGKELELPMVRTPESASPAGSDKSSVYLRRLQTSLLGSQLEMAEEPASPTGSETGSVIRRRTRSSWVPGSQEKAIAEVGSGAASSTRKSWASSSQAVSSSPAHRRASTSWKADSASKSVRRRRFTDEDFSSPAPPVQRSSSALGWVEAGNEELEEFASSRRLTRHQRSMVQQSFASRPPASAKVDEGTQEAAVPSDGDSDDASSTVSSRVRRASFVRAVSKMSPARSRGGSLPASRGPRSMDGDSTDGDVDDARRDVTKPDARSTRSRRVCASLGGAAPLAELNTIMEESTIAESESVEALVTDKPGPSRRHTGRLSPVSEETHNLRRKSRVAGTKPRSSLLLRGRRASFDATPRQSKRSSR